MRMMNTRDKREEKDIEDGLITAKEACDLQAELKKQNAIDKELVKKLTSALGGDRPSKNRKADPGALVVLLGCMLSQISTERRLKRTDNVDMLKGLIEETKHTFVDQVQAYERETGKKFKLRGKSTWRLNRREMEVPEGSACYEAKGFCYSCEEWASIGCRTPRERSELLLEIPARLHTCPSCGEKEALHLDVAATFKKEL